jgi:transcriptional regulator with XRE-family HTH domain
MHGVYVATRDTAGMTKANSAGSVGGTRIREARLALGLSQIELADRVQVSQPTIAHWEQGTHAPRQLALVRLADALGVSRAWLLDGAGAAQPLTDPTRSAHGRSYLTRPMRHAPMYLWPTTVSRALDCISGAAAPFDHLPISWDMSAPIAFLLDEADGVPDFSAGTVVVTDSADRTPLADGLYVVAVGDRVALRRWHGNEADQSGRLLGRVRLSIQRW